MQTYTIITNDFTGAELPGKIDENLQSLKSDFSGTVFPTEHLVEGMTCFRTDQKKVYRLMSDLITWKLESDLNYDGGVTVATQAQAEAGTDNTVVMTPLRVKQSVQKNAPAPAVMIGASASAGGKSGLVPQPSAGDNNKVLHGDGLWKKAIGFESYWEASEKVSVGDIRFPYGRENSGYILECVKEGTTGSNQPVVSENLIDDYPVNINNLEGTLGIERGGTGASTAKQALANLGALPLSGGVMTGIIQVLSSLGFLRRPDTSGTLSLYGGSVFENGATLSLVGMDNHVNAGEEGAFFLKTTDGVNPIYLAGYPNGHLYWGDKEVVSSKVTYNPTNMVIQFNDGLQVISGYANTVNSNKGTFTFPLPFVSEPTVIVSPKMASDVNTVTYHLENCYKSTTQMGVVASIDGYSLYYDFIAIGRWKW